jgi:hypothetical protein
MLVAVAEQCEQKILSIREQEKQGQCIYHTKLAVCVSELAKFDMSLIQQHARFARQPRFDFSQSLFRQCDALVVKCTYLFIYLFIYLFDKKNFMPKWIQRPNSCEEHVQHM